MTYLSVGCEANARFLNAMPNCVPCDGVPFVIFFKGMYNKEIIRFRFVICRITKGSVITLIIPDITITPKIK